MRRRRGSFGKVLIFIGAAAIIVSFCSFKMVCTFAAIMLIIVGTKLVICS